jgi:hypothetical protein
MEIAREMGVATRLAYRSGNTDGVVLPDEQCAQVFVHYDGVLYDVREISQFDDIKCKVPELKLSSFHKFNYLIMCLSLFLTSRPEACAL